MIKYLLIFPALLLIGAGCATTVQTTSDSEGVVVQEQPVIPTNEDGEETQDEVDANGEEMIVTDDEGNEIVFETKETAEVDEDGVPIIDVELGASAQTISIDAGNFFFSPKTIEAKAGEKITITFSKNIGFHTFVIDELDLKFAIKEGEALSFKAPTKPGTYTFYCDIGSHRASGMEGTLIVK